MGDSTQELDQHGPSDPARVGETLELYRNYLYLLAQADSVRNSVRADVSDVVQETILEAYRGFDRYRGTSKRELMAWLRQILVRNLTDAARRRRAQRRDERRHRSLHPASGKSANYRERRQVCGIPRRENIHQHRALRKYFRSLDPNCFG